MSFRLEEKIPATPYEIALLYQQLQQQGMQPLYPSRTIHSVYFDNAQQQILADSEEGCLPRRKTRIRHYPQEKDIAYQLEIKISSIEGRYKTSKTLSAAQRQEYLENGIYDVQYGLLIPQIAVEYTREYCQLDNIRLTFDRHIFYCDYRNDRKYHEAYQVLEIKNPEQENLSFIDNLIPARRHRFSKFSRAMLNIET